MGVMLAFCSLHLMIPEGRSLESSYADVLSELPSMLIGCKASTPCYWVGTKLLKGSCWLLLGFCVCIDGYNEAHCAGALYARSICLFVVVCCCMYGGRLSGQASCVRLGILAQLTRGLSTAYPSVLQSFEKKHVTAAAVCTPGTPFVT